MSRVREYTVSHGLTDYTLVVYEGPASQRAAIDIGSHEPVHMLIRSIRSTADRNGYAGRIHVYRDSPHGRLDIPPTDPAA